MHSQTVHSHIETLCSRGNSNLEVLRLSFENNTGERFYVTMLPFGMYETGYLATYEFFLKEGVHHIDTDTFRNDDAPTTDKTLLIA